MNLKKLWQKPKVEIVQPVDECVCGQQLPFDFFVDGGKCPKCNLQIYQTKPKVKWTQLKNITSNSQLLSCRSYCWH